MCVRTINVSLSCNGGTRITISHSWNCSINTAFLHCPKMLEKFGNFMGNHPEDDNVVVTITPSMERSSGGSHEIGLL